MKTVGLAILASLLLSFTACVENNDPVPQTTTTTIDISSGYELKPLPRNGWSVEQGFQFREGLENGVGSELVNSQPDVVNCSYDWFIDHYTAEEILEFADQELINELAIEAVDACKQWIRTDIE